MKKSLAIAVFAAVLGVWYSPVHSKETEHELRAMRQYSSVLVDSIRAHLYNLNLESYVNDQIDSASVSFDSSDASHSMIKHFFSKDRPVKTTIYFFANNTQAPTNTQSAEHKQPIDSVQIYFMHFGPDSLELVDDGSGIFDKQDIIFTRFPYTGKRYAFMASKSKIELLLSEPDSSTYNRNSIPPDSLNHQSRPDLIKNFLQYIGL